MIKYEKVDATFNGKLWRHDVQAAMKVARISYNELAILAELHVTGSAIVHWVSGTVTPRLDRFLLVCNALDLNPVSYLFPA